jgi:hypothetical protein
MNIQIKATTAIDICVDKLSNEIDCYQRHFLHGKPQEERERMMNASYRAWEVVQAVADSLGIYRIDKAARHALRWYNRTRWEFCLSEDTAARLLQAAKDGQFEIPPEKESGYYLNWHRRNEEFRRRQAS